MNNPKISIVTVSYNAASTIERTILSVLEQKYENKEYIIIDGGSTDGTVDIIKKYSDRLAYWVSEPDKGIYDAMNKGIDKATGNVVGLINSDDYYAKGIFERIAVEFIRTEGRCVIHGDLVFVKNEKETRYSLEKRIERVWWDQFVAHPTVFVPKEVYTKFGAFDTQYRIAADYDLMLRFYLKGVGFSYIDEVVSYMADGGISNVNRIKGFKEVRRIALKTKTFNRQLINSAYIYKSTISLLVTVKDWVKKTCRKRHND